MYFADKSLNYFVPYFQYIDMHGGKPKRQYRKLCTAARVRPYNPKTGKVESPVKR